MSDLMHADIIKNMIYTIRGQRVMLDKDLAAEEWDILKSHFVTSNWGGVRKVPYAFTEQGVAMLSGHCN